MKKKIIGGILVVCLIAPMLIVLVACGQTNKCYSPPKKIADYLYEITYTNYTQDVNLETIKDAESFGCSSVRNGNFYGRNFDYMFNNVPEFIVKVNKSQTIKHSSIGVATHFGLREGRVESYNKQLELIPNFTLDGINDCGVICSHNVVVIEDDNRQPIHTNPGKPQLHMLFIPRYVLNNAANVNEAIELLKQKDIYGNLADRDYLHIMIADQNKTVVVEFYKSQMIVKEKFGDNQIMTNYYLNLPEINEHPQGLERFQILKEHYAEGNSIAGMQHLMRRVQYSKAYDANASEPWYSENLTKTQMQDENFKRQAFEESKTDFLPSYWEARNTNNRETNNPQFWITVHNSTYDMRARQLNVYVQEDYSRCYTFNLNQ